MKCSFIMFVAFIASSPSLAEVPHHFVPGSPARAAEVNANFDNLDQRTSDLQERIKDVEAALPANQPSLALIDSHGATVGIANISRSTQASVQMSINTAVGPLRVSAIFAPDRLVSIQSEYSGQGSTLAYTSSNCTGAPYIRKSVGAFPSAPSILGEPFPVDWNPLTDKLLVPAGMAISVVLSSHYIAGLASCEPTNESVEAYPMEALDFYTMHPPPYDIREQ